MADHSPRMHRRTVRPAVRRSDASVLGVTAAAAATLSPSPSLSSSSPSPSPSPSLQKRGLRDDLDLSSDDHRAAVDEDGAEHEHDARSRGQHDRNDEPEGRDDSNGGQHGRNDEPEGRDDSNGSDSDDTGTDSEERDPQDGTHAEDEPDTAEERDDDDDDGEDSRHGHNGHSMRNGQPINKQKPARHNRDHTRPTTLPTNRRAQTATTTGAASAVSADGASAASAASGARAKTANGAPTTAPATASSRRAATARRARRATVDSKLEALRRLRRLREEQRSTERQVATLLFRRHRAALGESTAAELEAEATALEESRAAELVALQEGLRRLQASVTQFTSLLGHVAPSPQYIARVKAAMARAEVTMSAFKAEQRVQYETLLKEEHTLGVQVAAMDANVEAWAQALAAGSSAAPRRRTGKPAARAKTRVATLLTEKDVPKEVAQYEHFLAEQGGSTGGWTEYDHGTFVHLRQKHRAQAPFFQAVAQALLGKSETDVVEHEHWYRQLHRLDEARRAAIEAWRAQQDEERRRAEAAAREAAEESAQAQANQQAARERAREERRQAQAAEVEAWRAQKAREEAEQRAAARQKAAARAEREARRQEEHREELRGQVETYIQRRGRERANIEAEQRRAAAVERRARRVRDEDLAAHRARDQERVQRQQEREAQAQKEEQERTARLERLRKTVQANIKVKRDPGRLMRPTAASKHRAEDTTSTGGQVVVRAPPRLAVPSWRQGL